MKPCIWYVSKYISPPTRANVGSRGYLLMKEFAKLGYPSLIITSDSNQLAKVPQLNQAYLFEELDGLKLCWVRTLKFKEAKSFRRVLSWLDFEWGLWRLPKDSVPRPDVIIVSSLSLLTIINGFIWRRKYKCRLIFEVRDIWPLTIVEEGGFKSWNPLLIGLSLIEKIGYRYADEIVGTMPNLGAHVTDVLGREKATSCIPMGIDDTSLIAGDDLPEDYVKKYIPKNKFIIVHAGGIGISNALDTMLDCAESMNEDAHVHFLVVGDGDLRKHYLKKYGHLRNITFAPRVPKQMVQSVLSHCDLLYFAVHTSKVWEYGQSLNKVIDYMLAGKPVVASYTGYPSMINEADCGSYVPAGDIVALQNEIQRYVDMEESQREIIGRRGRDWLIANRRYETLAQDYLSILFDEASLKRRGDEAA